MTELQFWRFKDQREKWTLGLAVLALVAALISGLFTGLQWYAANRSADAAKRSADLAQQTLDSASTSFQSQERAYVFVKHFALTKVDHPPFCNPPNAAPGRYVCLEVDIVNGGKTPAVGLRTVGFATAATVEAAPAKINEFSVPTYTPNGSVLGSSDGSTPDWTTAAAGPLSDLELKELKAGKIHLFIFGVVQYSDIFGKYHETGYCGFLLATGAFMYCPYHNWVDKKLPGQE